MSRIDEALRRAAEMSAAAAATEEPVGDTAAAPSDVATLAREPFPEEASDQCLEPPPAAGDDPEAEAGQLEGPVAAGAEPEAGGGDATEEAEPAPGPERLFERIDARLAEKVVADANMTPASREQYRKLAAVLHDAQAGNGIAVVMIASAVPGEGKTLTAVNLALTLSESYQRRVLLIDADLRKPMLHQIFQLTTSSGLTEGLTAGPDARLVLRQVSSRLSILPAGRPSADPMAALTSERMRRLIDEAREAFDWVIIDTPPLVLLPDAHILSSMVDGALLVVRADSTPHAMVKRAADIIGRDRITGVVLNKATADQPGYGGYYAPGYGQMPMRREAGRA